MTITYKMGSAPGALTIINDKQCNYFGGTSYYELHNNPDVKKAAIEAINKYGITSSSSRNSFGTTPLLLELEKKASDFFNCEKVAYLPSGFLSSIAALTVLIDHYSLSSIFIDEVSHYSNNYATKICGKPIYKFKHLDFEDLENKIKLNLKRGEKPLIITDGVFPIYGRIAPIDKYLEIAEKFVGHIWVDDAHGIAVLGENGRGTCEHHNLKSNRINFGGSMSKGFGGFGGIIPGEEIIINKIQMGDVQNGSTPPPSAAIAASLTGMKILESNPQMRENLWTNANKLKTGLNELGIETDKTKIPIATWTMNSSNEMEKLRNELMSKNISIQLINYVGSGDLGVLRIVVFSTHTNDQIDNLLFELNKLI